MARGDTGKWVTRAASTGGGRSYRGQMPVKWYGTLFLIVLVGVVSIVYSRYERENPTLGTPPTVGNTHWYASLAVDDLRVCEGFTNEGIAQEMALYQEAITKVPQRA